MSFHNTPAGLPDLYPQAASANGDGLAVESGRLPSVAAGPPVREIQVQSAVAFLQSSKTLERADVDKIAFLEANAQCSLAEIAEAYRRVFPQAEVTKALQAALASGKVSAAEVARGLTPAAMPYPPGTSPYPQPGMVQVAPGVYVHSPPPQQQSSVWPRVLVISGLLVGGLFAAASVIPHLFPAPSTSSASSSSSFSSSSASDAAALEPGHSRNQTLSPAGELAAARGPRRRSAQFPQPGGQPTPAASVAGFSDPGTPGPSLRERWRRGTSWSLEEPEADDLHLRWAGADQQKQLSRLSGEVADLRAELSDVLLQMRNQSRDTRDALGSFQQAMDRFIADDSLSKVSGAGAYNASSLQSDLQSLRSLVEGLKVSVAAAAAAAPPQESVAPPSAADTAVSTAAASEQSSGSSPSSASAAALSSLTISPSAAAAVSSSASEPSAVLPGPEACEATFRAALLSFVQRHPAEVALKSLQTIAFYIKHILSNLDSKGSLTFCRLVYSNAGYQTRVAKVEGAEAILLAAGFRAKRLMLEWPLRELQQEAQNRELGMQELPAVGLLQLAQTEIAAASSRLQQPVSQTVSQLASSELQQQPSPPLEDTQASSTSDA